MAKDPAVLWYWSDWNSGTSTLSRHLKGCYMDLLHAQFNNGRLSFAEIKTVLGTDFGNTWPTLQKKFKRDEREMYYNERLEIEQQKRQKFVASRTNNLKKPHMEPHMDVHMKPHMENVNVNRDETVFTWDSEKQKFLRDGNWIFKFCRDKNITVDEFDKRANEFLNDLELKEDYKSVKEVRRHFTNLFNKEKKNGTHKQSTPGSNRQQGANQLLDSLRKDLESSAGGGRNP